MGELFTNVGPLLIGLGNAGVEILFDLIVSFSRTKKSSIREDTLTTQERGGVHCFCRTSLSFLRRRKITSSGIPKIERRGRRILHHRSWCKGRLMLYPHTMTLRSQRGMFHGPVFPSKGSQRGSTGAIRGRRGLDCPCLREGRVLRGR